MTRVSITAGATAGGTRRAATHYGRRLEESTAMSEHNVSQDTFKQTMTFSYADLDILIANGDELFQRVPAGARVLAAKVKVTEAFLGGTSLAIGLAQEDGTEGSLDLDGLVTDANAPLANLGAGAYVDGTGALVGDTSGLAVDGILTVAATGTFTAGEATIEVEYETPADRTQTMNG